MAGFAMVSPFFGVTYEKFERFKVKFFDVFVCSGDQFVYGADRVGRTGAFPR